MEFFAIYRTHAGENRAPRPPWYSKPLCWRSFLQAFAFLQRYGPARLLVLHDGPIDQNREWAEILKAELPPAGEILEITKGGNAQAFLSSIRLACDLPPDSIVTLAEDDYLWTSTALTEQTVALQSVQADYATGYDHPDRYRPPHSLSSDLPHWDRTIYLAAGRHWRTHESTCLTFTATASIIRADASLFHRYSYGRAFPNDRDLFRHLQSLGGHGYFPRRRLIGPIPSLSTHAHLPWLAPFVDWQAVAESVAREGADPRGRHWALS